MSSIKVLGRTFTGDSIIYFDSINGLDTNDGLTIATAVKTSGYLRKMLENSSGSTCVVYICDGEQTLYISGAANKKVIYVANPEKCSIKPAATQFVSSSANFPAPNTQLECYFLNVVSTSSISLQCNMADSSTAFHNCQFLASYAGRALDVNTNSKHQLSLINCTLTNALTSLLDLIIELSLNATGDRVTIENCIGVGCLGLVKGNVANVTCINTLTRKVAYLASPALDGIVTPNLAVVNGVPYDGDTPIEGNYGVMYGDYSWINPNKFFLKNNNKFYTIGILAEQPNAKTALLEVSDLIDSDSIADLSLITKELISELTGDVYLVQVEPDTGAELAETFESMAIILEDNSYITATGDIDVTTVEELSDVTVDYSVIGTGYLRMAISTDSGVTWQTFDADTQTFVPLASLNTDLKTSGIDPMVLQNITVEQWKTFFPYSTLRFAYGLYQVAPADNILLRKITLTFKYEGVFAQPQYTDATYAKGTGFIEVNFKTTGTYVVNYHYKQ